MCTWKKTQASLKLLGGRPVAEISGPNSQPPSGTRQSLAQRQRSTQRLADCIKSISMVLQDLPPDCLRLVLRQLSTKDLAAVSAQCNYLRAEAGADDLWRPHVLDRYPDCCTMSDHPSLRALYSMRAMLPAGFGSLVDKVAKVQARAEAGVPLLQILFIDSMRKVYMLGLLFDLAPLGFDERNTPEYARLVAIISWWLETKPEVAVCFVRDTTAVMLTEAEQEAPTTRQQRFIGCDLAWRRSAIAFLADILRDSACRKLHPSIFEALRSNTATLNRSMERLALPASPAPAGVPRSHWWWLQDDHSRLWQVASPA